VSILNEIVMLQMASFICFAFDFILSSETPTHTCTCMVMEQLLQQ